MIKREDLIEIGEFIKTHGILGELNTLLDVDEDFVRDECPFIIEIDGIFIPFYANSMRFRSAHSSLIHLQGVNSDVDAKQFVGKIIYARRSDLVKYWGEAELEEELDFIGLTIIDTNLGTIGEIVDIEDSTENVLFLVKDSSGKIIYIPAVDEFIDIIDDNTHTVTVTLPDGLVDLND